MKEEIVPYRIALLAKEAGFNHIKPNCFGDNLAYNKEGELICAHKGNTVEEYILAPTRSYLQKWLRENYNIHIEIRYQRYYTPEGKLHSQYDADSYRYENNSAHYENQISLTNYDSYNEVFDEILEEILEEILNTINNERRNYF